jgi:guanylate kinase
MTAARRGILVVVSGPSGVGKTTVIEALLRRPGFSRGITATTRPPRGAEREGVDYRFLARDRFEEEVRRGRFLEHATVHGHLYGTPRDAVEAVLARGEDCLLNVDVQGAEALRRSGLPVLTFFLLPPSPEELERRLAGRGTESPEEKALRLETAKRETAQAGRFDARVVNDDVGRAAEEVARIVEARRGKARGGDVREEEAP